MTTTLTLTAGTGDCWTDFFGGSFGSTEVDLDLVQDGRVWFPFTAPISKNATVISATLRVIAEVTSAATTSHVKVGCEAADNPANPVSSADLNGRTFTTWTNTVTLTQYISGSTYSYDVTGAVQEILNRSGWVNGNTMAVMMLEVDSVSLHRWMYSANNGANQPVLEVVVSSFIPRAVSC